MRVIPLLKQVLLKILHLHIQMKKSQILLCKKFKELILTMNDNYNSVTLRNLRVMEMLRPNFLTQTWKTVSYHIYRKKELRVLVLTLIYSISLKVKLKDAIHYSLNLLPLVLQHY